MFFQLGRINDDLEERNVSLDEENNLLKLKVSESCTVQFRFTELLLILM